MQPGMIDDAIGTLRNVVKMFIAVIVIATLIAGVVWFVSYPEHRKNEGLCLAKGGVYAKEQGRCFSAEAEIHLE